MRHEPIIAAVAATSATVIFREYAAIFVILCALSLIPIPVYAGIAANVLEDTNKKPLARQWSFAMAAADRRDPNVPGRRALDAELWAIAKEAKREAEDARDKAIAALNAIQTHTAVCEEQNKTIISRLDNHASWREEDLKFQRRVMLGIIGAIAMALLDIVIRGAHL